jgi:hypothetical protein
MELLLDMLREEPNAVAGAMAAAFAATAVLLCELRSDEALIARMRRGRDEEHPPA